LSFFSPEKGTYLQQCRWQDEPVGNNAANPGNSVFSPFKKAKWGSIVPFGGFIPAGYSYGTNRMPG
jgi:hypothetical protein